MNLKKALRDLIQGLQGQEPDKIARVANLLSEIDKNEDGEWGFALANANLDWLDEQNSTDDERFTFEAMLNGREFKKYRAIGFQGNYLRCSPIGGGFATDQLLGRQHVKVEDHLRFDETLRHFQGQA